MSCAICAPFLRFVGGCITFIKVRDASEMREGGLFFICWRFCLLIWYLMLILYNTWYSHVPESRCLLAPRKFMVVVLGLTWIGMDIWIILFLDLILSNYDHIEKHFHLGAPSFMAFFWKVFEFFSRFDRVPRRWKSFFSRGSTFFAILIIFIIILI